MRQAYDYWQDQPGYCITEIQLIEISRIRFWKRSSEESELISLSLLQGARYVPSFQATECEQSALQERKSTTARTCQVPSRVHVTASQLVPTGYQYNQHSILSIFEISLTPANLSPLPHAVKGARQSANEKCQWQVESGSVHQSECRQLKLAAGTK